MFKSMLIVGAGGFVGSCLRYLTSIATASLCPASFPIGTFIVNILGCFIIGICYGLSEKAGVMSANTLLFLTTGICGGFTTFSTFANEVWMMGSRGQILSGIGYLVASVACGYLCVWLGRCLTA